MPAYGRAVNSVSNIVKNVPTLPVAMFFGSISATTNFESFPTASLQYKGVLLSDLSSLESNYKIGTNIILYGIPYSVASYAYAREGYVIRDFTKFSVYSVTINLESKYQKAVNAEIKLLNLADANGKVSITAIANAAKVPYSGPEFYLSIPPNSDKNYSSTLKNAVDAFTRIKGCFVSYTKGVELIGLERGGSWTFPEHEIISDGQNTLQLAPAYNRAVLTGAFSELINDTDSPDDLQFTYIGPRTEIIIEEDEYPAEPPEGSTVLRTLDSCFDLSGPKKVKKVTTQVYDNPESEEIWVYGFVYTASDIYNANVEGGLYSSTPEIFWKVVEYKKTNYIYKNLPPVTLQVFATDPTDASKKYPVLIKPGYEQFARVGLLGGEITFTSTAAYSTEVVTKGWRLARFAREGEHGVEFDTKDAENPFFNACKFKKIPSEEKTVYLLKSTRAEYGDDVGLPFSVEWVDYESLDRSLKERIDISKDVNNDGQVALLTPDINYVEPLFISVEATQKSSFAFMPNPESEPPDDLKPYLTTGEETYQQTKRTTIASNKYKEKVTEFSAQDPGFSVSSEQVRFKEVLGRPPEASYRLATAEQIKPTSNQRGNNNVIKKYYVSSDLSANVPIGGSLNYPEAKTIEEAITAAKTDLQIAQIQSSQQSKTVSWFYPNIMAGDRVSTGLDRFASVGNWLVTSSSWTLSYNGNNNKLRALPLVTCEGTQLNLGLLASRNVSYDVEEEPTPNNNSDGQSGEIDINFSGGNYSLGSMLLNSPNRRRF